MRAGKLYRKGVETALALGPDPAAMLFDDALGNGKTQSVAAVHGAGLVDAVEPLENVFQILLGDGFTGVVMRCSALVQDSGYSSSMISISIHSSRISHYSL